MLPPDEIDKGVALVILASLATIAAAGLMLALIVYSLFF